MSGLRERMEAKLADLERDADGWDESAHNGARLVAHVLRGAVDDVRRILDADPAASAADAPADTTLRDQIAAVIHKTQWGDQRPGVVTVNDTRIADALLPLLRAQQQSAFEEGYRMGREVEAENRAEQDTPDQAGVTLDG